MREASKHGIVEIEERPIKLANQAGRVRHERARLPDKRYLRVRDREWYLLREENSRGDAHSGRGRVARAAIRQCSRSDAAISVHSGHHRRRVKSPPPEIVMAMGRTIWPPTPWLPG